MAHFSFIGKCIFASLIVSFCHGREEDEVMEISFKKELAVDKLFILLMHWTDLNSIHKQLFFERYSHNLVLFTAMTKEYNQAGKNTLPMKKKSSLKMN